MKFRPIALFLIFLPVSICFGGGKTLPKMTVKTLKAKITHILNSHPLESSFAGVQIMDLATGRVVYDLNSEKLFHPASNTKLITTAAALALIPDYQFKTTVGAQSTPKDSVISGNLYITSSGDPVLGSVHFDSLAAQLYARGIRKINGDIVGDVSRFDTVAWGSGWMWDDEPSSDEPFITPLSVNGNKITLTVSPGIIPGAKPLYTMLPDTKLISIQNNATTGWDSASVKLQATRHHGLNDVTLFGNLPSRSASKDLEVSISTPEMFFLNHFKERLAAHGITVTGNVTIGRYAGSTLAEISHSLDTAIFYTNKESNNLGAESFVKTLGAELNHTTGSWQNGLPVIRSYLSSIGIDTTNTILNDGSGVSFYNLVTPSNLVTLLADRFRDQAKFGRFYNSLPIAGVDGTLKNRMKGTRAAGNVHAKTGTITGVSALSGYVHDGEYRLYAFSIMCNHFPGETKVMREVQDEILELLAGSIIRF